MADVESLTLNGGTENQVMAQGTYAAVGTVTVQEV